MKTFTSIKERKISTIAKYYKKASRVVTYLNTENQRWVSAESGDVWVPDGASRAGAELQEAPSQPSARIAGARRVQPGQPIFSRKQESSCCCLKLPTRSFRPKETGRRLRSGHGVGPCVTVVAPGRKRIKGCRGQDRERPPPHALEEA